MTETEQDRIEREESETDETYQHHCVVRIRVEFATSQEADIGLNDTKYTEAMRVEDNEYNDEVIRQLEALVQDQAHGWHDTGVKVLKPEDESVAWCFENADGSQVEEDKTSPRDRLLADLSPLTTDNWHLFVLGQVEAVYNEGLRPAYNGDVVSFLYDVFTGDMPWGEVQNSVVSQNIKDDPRFESLRERFQEKFGQDFWGEGE